MAPQMDSPRSQDLDWARAIEANPTRVTIRIPRRLANRMDVEARTHGRSLNEEYTRAIADWCSDQHWFEVLLNEEDLQPTVDEELIQGGQLAPVVVDRLVVAGKVGFSVGGHAMTVWRDWFKSRQAFEGVRQRLEDDRVPMLVATSPPGGGPETVVSATYGWLGVRPREEAKGNL